jgi:hypothetical protein
MTKNEVKKLVKRRQQLVSVFKDFNSDLKEGEATETLEDIAKNTRNDLGDIVRTIDEQLLTFVKEDPVGVWLLQIKGVTPDIAAGLLAYFDITGKECAAQFIKYAGADNYNNAHNNSVREILNRLENNFKFEKDSMYDKFNAAKFAELSANMEPLTAKVRADRYTRKLFISHLFEEMYREAHNGELPRRYENTDCTFIAPEVPYTK